jgi:hypothetical protein
LRRHLEEVLFVDYYLYSFLFPHFKMFVILFIYVV